MNGKTLAQYQIVEKIGSGGMGTVYRARDTRLDRDVAIKVLPAELTRDPGRRTRFVQEAKSASAVNHPAIAPIYEIGEDGEDTFIAMEFVDGSTVRQLIQRDELDIGAAVEIGIQVGDALASAHRAGIVHRDIKSDNIMVTRDGHPKVLDFGLAKLVDHGGGDEDDTIMADQKTMAMTQAGMVMGTVAYMSPEQARGLPADQRSDIFSFGIVLYEMATGQLPFHGDSALDTMHAIAFDKSVPIATMREGLPYALQRIIDHCMEKVPDKRYQTLDETIDDLRKVKRQLDSGASMSMPFLERWRPARDGLKLGELSTRGAIVAVAWTLILGSLLITVLSNGGNLWGALPFILIGLMVFGHFRRRRRSMVDRFVNRTKKMKEVQLISWEEDHFVVVVEGAVARSYLKLNATLEGVNDKLYSGRAMELEVRENLSAAELRELAVGSKVRYLRKGL
jgi:serine/threonine protein kinase